MEQHPVPQHIASFEFKLFGNLTVRQFVTLAIPMSVAVALFFSGLPTIIRYALAIFFGGLGLFAALVPIGGRPLDKWIVAFIKAISSPTQRVWVKEAKLPEFLNIVISTPGSSSAPTEPITTQDRERLFSYLRSVPKGQVSPFDVKEQVALSRLGLSYDEGARGGKLPPPIMWATPGPVSKGGSLPQVSTMGAQAAPVPVFIEEGLPVDRSKYQGSMADALPVISDKPKIRTKISDHAKAFALPGLEKKLNRILQRETARKPIELVSVPQLQLASETNFSIENVIPISTPGRRVKLLHGIGKTRARKLHFAPPSGFDLGNLPIRGEARFEISEELKKGLGMEDKEAVIDQMFAKEDAQEKAAPSLVQAAVPTPEPKATPALHKEETKAKVVEHVSVKPQAKIQAQGVRMHQEHQAEVDSKISSFATGNLAQHTKNAEVLSRAQIVPLTNKPNVLSGLVASPIGVPLDGVIITVRDRDGVPVRALKTNKLGQFLSATPLLTGDYTLEIEGQQNRFEPVTISLKGEVVSPLEIKAQA